LSWQQAEVQREQFTQRVKQLQLQKEQQQAVEAMEEEEKQNREQQQQLAKSPSAAFSPMKHQNTTLDPIALTTPTNPTSIVGLQRELSRQFAVADAFLDVLVSSTESHAQFLKAYTQRLALRKGRLSPALLRNDNNHASDGTCLAKSTKK
jgi:TolA-binding protein